MEGGLREKKKRERERKKDRFRWKPNVPELNCGITATSDAEFILGLDGVVWRCYVVISEEGSTHSIPIS